MLRGALVEPYANAKTVTSGFIPAGVECAACVFLWPKSLSTLMLLGVAVIAVPLLVAIFNAALQIQQLADSSRTIASEGIGAARASED